MRKETTKTHFRAGGNPEHTELDFRRRGNDSFHNDCHHKIVYLNSGRHKCLPLFGLALVRNPVSSLSSYACVAEPETGFLASQNIEPELSDRGSRFLWRVTTPTIYPWPG